MKLSQIHPQFKAEKIQVKKRTEIGASDAAAPSAAAGADRVELSTASFEVQKMKDILQQTPDVRMERVQALKGMIERGEYQVDPYRVADKMLMSLLQDNILE